MEGWCWPEKALAMAELILEVKPAVCVEIGVFGGRSLVPQGIALANIGRGRVYGIDPWKNEAALEGDVGAENADWWKKLNLHEIHQKCMEALWRYSLDEFVCVLRSTSQASASLFPAIDILHLDGNHSELSSCRDVALYGPRIVPGGHLWMDDTDWATTQPAIRLIEQDFSLVKKIGATALYRKTLVDHPAQVR